MTYSHSGTFSYGQQIAWTIKLFILVLMSQCSKSLHVRLVSLTGIVITSLARVGGKGDIDLKAINCRDIVYKCVAIPSGWLYLGCGMA